MSRFGRMVIWIALAAIVLAAFWPVLNCQFVRFDDPGYVTENEHVQRGITFNNLVWAFQDYSASNWHPVTWLSLMFDCQLYGLNPTGHHLTSLLIHLASTLLLFATIRQMTSRLWPSAFVAALFGIHPLHVESVAWIAERKDVLSAFFWMVTLWCYARYAQQHVNAKDAAQPFWKFAYYHLALSAFLLGLMSKAMLVTGPFVLLLIDYWPLKRLDPGNLRASKLTPLIYEKVPFFILTVAVSFITFFAQKSTGAVKELTALSLDQRVANAVVSYGRYLVKTIWPTHLAVQYPHPGKWPLAIILTCAAALIAITWLAIKTIRSQPSFIVGWLWFLGTLVPVIGIVQVGDQAMADRFSYIPSIGLFMAVAFALANYAHRFRNATTPLAFASSLALIACALATHAQTQYWRNTETLFRHSVEVTDRNLLAYNNLARALEDEGRINEASATYSKGLQIDPNFAPLQSNFGLLLMRRGQVDEAKSHLSQAIKLEPDSPSIQYNWGRLEARLGHLDSAIAAFQRAIQLQSNFAKAHIELAGCYNSLGRTTDAIAEYEKALKFQHSVEALNNFGDLLISQNQPQRALPLLIDARQLAPNRADVRNNLGNCFAALNKPDEAFAEFNAALRLNPTNATYYYNRGNLLARANRFDDAIASYNSGLQYAPADIDLHFNLGSVLAHQNRTAEANEHFNTALTLAQQSNDKTRIAQIQTQLAKLNTQSH